MLANTDTPRWIEAILSWPWLLPVARLALASAYLIGGVQKLVDFPGAVAEQAQFGLQPGFGYRDAYTASTLLNSSTQFPRGIP